MEGPYGWFWHRGADNPRQIWIAGGVGVAPFLGMAKTVDFSRTGVDLYYCTEGPEHGGLMSYGADLAELFSRAASYVDRILKGAKPSDLPVEQPTVFEMVVNRKTANALGLAIPRSLLLRANQVIE